MPKRVNPNLAKIHRNYSVGEAAALLGVHKNTVRNWIKNGLPLCDDRRPALILGAELREFPAHEKAIPQVPLQAVRTVLHAVSCTQTTGREHGGFFSVERVNGPPHWPLPGLRWGDEPLRQHGRLGRDSGSFGCFDTEGTETLKR